MTCRHGMVGEARRAGCRCGACTTFALHRHPLLTLYRPVLRSARDEEEVERDG